MYCKNCGAQLSDGSSFCTQCGWKTEAWNNEIAKAKKNDRTNKFAMIFFLIIVIFIILIFVMLGLGGNA